MAVIARLLLGLRVLEALVMSMLAGLMVSVVTRLFLPVPLLPSAILGFLAGGTTMLRTLGVAIERRRPRVVLAVVCAVLAWTTVHGVNYAVFRSSLRRSYHAKDYRLSDAQVDERIDTTLRDLTGSKGIVGYSRVALKEGAAVGLGLRLNGARLMAYTVVEFAVLLGIATAWAYGPTSRRRPAALDDTSAT